MILTFKEIFESKEYFDFYFMHADLYHGTIEQELEGYIEKKLKHFFIIDESKSIIGCFSIINSSIGYFVFLKSQVEEFKSILSFWRSIVTSKIELSISSRYLANFLELNFKLKYSRTRMELDLDNFTLKGCELDDNFEELQRIDPDNVNDTERIAITLYNAYKGTTDEQLFYQDGLDSVKETTELTEVFQRKHREFKMIPEGSFVYKKANFEIQGVIIIANWLDEPLIYNFAVDKHQQGKKLGYYMLCSSIKALKLNNYKKLSLYVTIGNSKAEKLYSGMNFVKDKYDFCFLENLS